MTYYTDPLVTLLHRWRRWRDKCREGDGYLVMWCVTHHCPWDSAPRGRCEARR